MIKKNKIAIISTIVFCIISFFTFTLTAFGTCGVADNNCVYGCTPAPDPDCDCDNVPNSAGLIPCGKTVNDPDTDWNECVPCTLCSLLLMGQLIIEFLVKIAAILALISITFAGLLYMFAAGSSGAIEKAKSMMKYALLGFVLVFIAWAIVDSILITMGYINPIGGDWHITDC